jgi:hypothetical protein
VWEIDIWASQNYVLAGAKKIRVFKGRKLTKSILFLQFVTQGISKTEFPHLGQFANWQGLCRDLQIRPRI